VEKVFVGQVTGGGMRPGGKKKKSFRAREEKFGFKVPWDCGMACLREKSSGRSSRARMTRV